MSTPGSITTLEAIQRERAPGSGAEIWQLTSAPAIHTSIYMDLSYADASSRYVIYLKSRESYGDVEVWRLDLVTKWAERVCEGVFRWEGITVSPDQRFFYCARRPAPEVFRVIRTDIVSLEQATVDVPCPYRLIGGCASVAPDGRALVMSAYLGPHRWGVLRLDLEQGTCRVIHEGGDELIGGNPTIDPGGGRDLLLQVNRGAVCEDDGRILQGTGEEGATLRVIDLDGGDVRAVPVGRPFTGPCGGHQGWIGKTGGIIANVGHDEGVDAARRGCLAIVSPGLDQVRVIGQGWQACHVNASRDGRYFVTDTWRGGTLVVGAIRTGRFRVMCESGASLGGPQYTHTHPWLTPDNRWVVFTSDRTGVPHVYAARVPEGLEE